MEGRMLSLFVLLCSISLSLGAYQATINVVDSGSPTYHTHAGAFQITVTATYQASGSDKISWQWQDADKNALSGLTVINSGVATVINSPDSRVGYYALVFSAGSSIILPRRNAGETLSLGFAIQAQRGFSIQQSSYFGTVHTDVNDPYMPSWVKTMWWNGASASTWSSTITQEQTKGKLELGIIAITSTPNGINWDTQPNDGSVISQTQLNQLQSEAQNYFAAYAQAANAADQYVELGLEENLGSNFGQTYFFSNLQKKVAAMRAGAAAAGANNLKFIYQVVANSFNGAPNPDIQNFINSVAFPSFDVLSIHIYPWTTFPMPDTFLAYVVNQAKGFMTTANRVKPIWFTEAGIPLNDPPVSPYTDGGAVTGSTTTYAAKYMARFHALAIALGVQKVFWYHYSDWEFDRNEAEDNFGMITFDGWLQPTYAVMINQQNKLDGTVFVASSTISGGFNNYHYQQTSANKDLFIVWHPTATSTSSVALSSIKAGLTSTNAQVYDKVGHPVTITSNTIPVGDSPLYIVTTITATATTAATTAATTSTHATTASATTATHATTASATTASVTTATATTGATGSASCTIVIGTTGTITSSGGNTWSITSGQQIKVNGVVDTDTSGVTELAYISGVLYQFNIWGNWYWKSLPTDAWSGPTTTDPTTASCVYLVFDETVSSGWAASDLNGAHSLVTTQAYTGTTSVKFVDNGANTYGLVEFDRTATLSLSGKTHLSIAVLSGQAAFGAQIQAWTGQWTSSVPWVQFTSYGAAAVTTKWTVYNIPLSAFGLSSVIQHIAIQDGIGGQNTYYYDRIQIIKLA